MDRVLPTNHALSQSCCLSSQGLGGNPDVGSGFHSYAVEPEMDYSPGRIQAVVPKLRVRQQLPVPDLRPGFREVYLGYGKDSQLVSMYVSTGLH